MRFAIILAAAALLAAPAFAQRAVPADVMPDQPAPPEGFYKNIPNMYDLLARPVPLGELTLVGERKLTNTLRACAYLPENPTDRERAEQKACSAPAIQEFIRSLEQPGK
jgi:hypothetical protein